MAEVQAGQSSTQQLNAGINQHATDLSPNCSLKVSDRAEHLGSGLLHRGLKPNPDTFIGIFAQNRPEVSVEMINSCSLKSVLILRPHFAPSQWIIGELACYTYSMVAVPLYDTLGPEALVFIINQGNWSFFESSAGTRVPCGHRLLISFHLFVTPAPFI